MSKPKPNVIQVDFSRRARLVRALSDLESLPRSDGTGRVALVAIDEDIVVVLHDNPDSGPVDVLGRFNFHDLNKYFYLARGQRQRIEQQLKQIECPHEDRHRRRGRTAGECDTCSACGAAVGPPRARAWSNCGLRDGEGSRCRRRVGHSGPCSFPSRGRRHD